MPAPLVDVAPLFSAPTTAAAAGSAGAAAEAVAASLCEHGFFYAENWCPVGDGQSLLDAAYRVNPGPAASCQPFRRRSEHGSTSQSPANQGSMAKAGSRASWKSPRTMAQSWATTKTGSSNA